MNEIQQQIRAISAAISEVRMPATPGEYDIHAEVSAALQLAGIAHSHEFKLAPRCRIDFCAGRVGIEIKKGRPTPALLREQLSRYLASDAIDAIVVVTQRAVNLPHTIHGKTVKQISLNRLWGVALP